MLNSYSICVRKNANTCCVQYTVCAEMGSFSLSSGAANLAAGTPAPPAGMQLRMFNFPAEDSSCFRDYIRIPGMHFFFGFVSDGLVFIFRRRGLLHRTTRL